jgi:hypothetical protein
MRIMDVRICSLETPDMRRMRLTLSSSHDLAQYLHILPNVFLLYADSDEAARL